MNQKLKPVKNQKEKIERRKINSILFLFLINLLALKLNQMLEDFFIAT